MASIGSLLGTEAPVLFALALLMSAGGFYRVVYFVSLGYAFSIAAMATASVYLFRGSLSPTVIAQLALLAVYGLRLGGYLVKREGTPAYRRELADAEKRGVGLGAAKKVAIWFGVSLLYVLMFSPCLFNLALLRATHGAASPGLLPVGLAVMSLGLALESAADWQKSRFKRQWPDRFCNVGLYRMVRCPNYLGEIVFWVGNTLAGASALSGWGHAAAALTGMVCIALIMMGSTKRLESKQEERYGASDDYRRYIASVPVLFPLVPIYSLKNLRVYLE